MRNLLVNLGSVSDIDCHLKLIPDITIEELNANIEHEKLNRNRSSVIQLLERRVRKVSKANSKSVQP